MYDRKNIILWEITRILYYEADEKTFKSRRTNKNYYGDWSCQN